MLQLKCTGLSLTAQNSLSYAEGSVDVPVKIEFDSTYNGYTKTLSVGYYDEFGVEQGVEVQQTNDQFLMPGPAFAQSGIIFISVHFKKDGVTTEPETNAVNYYVTKTARGSGKLNARYTWEPVVKSFVDQYLLNNPPTVVTDTTLKISGQAADAKVVGEKFEHLNEAKVDKPIGGNGTVGQALLTNGDGTTYWGEVQTNVFGNVEPMEDDIPKVFFGGDLPQTKTDTIMPFRYISKTMDINGYCITKAQGNSTMSKPKKNQTIKIFKDANCTEKLKVDLKGWGKQNKFVIKANYDDLTHSRNVVSARLWGDVVRSRGDYEELPQLLKTSPNQGAIDGFPIKVYANGIYQGRYTLNIPKDKWTFNMNDELDEHCVLCGEGYVGGCFREVSMAQWTDEIHDTCPSSIQTRWLEIIDFVMNSNDEAFVSSIGNYFDINSLVDYHLFGLLSCGLDAYGKNQLYFTYDVMKWFASMYDMDWTWGLHAERFEPTDYPRTSYEDYKVGGGNLLYIRLESLLYKLLYNRWQVLKKTVLSIENIINRFERFTDIAPKELVEEDYATTTCGGACTEIPLKETNNIQQIRAYALARLKWVDDYVNALLPNGYVPCTSIALSKTNLTFTSSETQTLTATVTPSNTTDVVEWSSSNPIIATVSNGKVTALTNGNVVITATCGGYSATCNVSITGIVEPIPCTSIKLDKNSIEFTDTNKTEIITTTITPSNTTDVVEWRSSDEDVATVNNGIVTPIGNGDCVITATCGEHSVQCNVSVKMTLAYSVSNVVFDGSQQAIDTGVQLGVENTDFAIFVDLENMSANTSNAYVFYNVANSSGVSLNLRSGKFAFQTNGTFQDIMNYDSSRHKMLFVRTVDGGMTVYADTPSNTITKDYTHAQFTDKMCIGNWRGSQSTIDGVTIHNFKVWKRALTNEEIVALFS